MKRQSVWLEACVCAVGFIYAFPQLCHGMDIDWDPDGGWGVAIFFFIIPATFLASKDSFPLNLIYAGIISVAAWTTFFIFVNLEKKFS